MVTEVAVHLGDQLGVVGTGLVEPEDGRPAGRPRPVHGELDPVLDRGVLDLAGPPDVPGPDLVRHEHRAVVGDHRHRAGLGDLVGLVVTAVLFGLLGHEPDVGHGAHRRRIEGAVGAAVLEGLGVEVGVAAVGDDRLGLLQFTIGVPHHSARADHRRHRRIDDDVARHVQVGDAPVPSRPSPDAGPFVEPLRSLRFRRSNCVIRQRPR